MSLDASTTARLIAKYPELTARIPECVETTAVTSNAVVRILSGGNLVDTPAGYSRTRKFLLAQHGVLSLVESDRVWCSKCHQEIV